MTKIDILVFAAHPDDAELACSGTIAKEVANGKKVAIVDLTQGEMGTRGTPELRLQEAQKAADVLGLTARENLGFKDCFFKKDDEHLMKIAEMIRKYQPEVVLANAEYDRHPDHGKAGDLIETAVFWSGLRKMDIPYDPWRPKRVYHYIQDRITRPDFVVDITDQWETKLNSIKAFSSQFYDPDNKLNEPQSYISSQRFWKVIEARAREYGHHIGVEFAEGFTCRNPIELRSVL